MGLFLAAELVAAGVTGLLLLVFGSSPGQNELVVALLSVSALVSASFLLIRPSRLPVWLYHTVLLISGLGVTVAIYYGGDLRTSIGLLYIWGAAYGSVFFFQWRAIAYAGLGVIAYWMVLEYTGTDAVAHRMLLHAASIFVVGVGFSIVVSREWSFRQDSELSRQEELEQFYTRSQGLQQMLSGAITQLRGIDEEMTALVVRSGLSPNQAAPDLSNVSQKISTVAQFLPLVLEHQISVDPIAPTIRKPTNVYAMCRDVVEPFAAQVQDRADIVLAPSPPDNELRDLELALDEARLSHAVQGILQNAVDHTDHPDGEIDVRLAVQVTNDNVFVRIQDNGPGFSGQDLDQVLERSARLLTAPIRRSDGRLHFGLGLRQARDAVERHEGNLTLARNGSTIVEIRLPRRTNSLSVLRPTQHSPIVVVIDDHLVDGKLLQSMLKDRGFRIVPVLNQGEALRRIDAESDVDLVFVEVQKLDEPPTDFIGRVQEADHDRVPPKIVAFTEMFSYPGGKDECAAQGFNGLLPKPLDEMILRDLLIELGL